MSWSFVNYTYIFIYYFNVHVFYFKIIALSPELQTRLGAVHTVKSKKKIKYLYLQLLYCRTGSRLEHKLFS